VRWGAGNPSPPSLDGWGERGGKDSLSLEGGQRGEGALLKKF